MVNVMKLTNTNVLGRNYVNRGNDVRRIKSQNENFTMTRNEVITHGVKLSDVTDKLGMLLTTVALGDEIAETIRLGQNVTAMEYEQFVNDEGEEILGDRAPEVALMYAGLYWECWDKATKTIDMGKAKEIVDARKGMKMEPVYTEADITITSNKYGRERKVLVVNDYYIKKCEEALQSINYYTTLKDLELFQEAFVFPTRGLGEQTIDCKKDISKKFCRSMKDLISPYFTVVGGLKRLESNITSYRRNDEAYTITAPANDDKVRYCDIIGDFKQAGVDTMEDKMNEFIDILNKETNYEFYNQYKEIDLLAGGNIIVANAIDKVGDILMTEDGAISDENRERALAAIYHLADEVGVERHMVVKIAIKLAISEVRQNRNGDVIVNCILDTEKEYKADLWKVAMLFGDIFVAEYAGKDVLEIPVDYETETDIADGEIIEIMDGYGYCGMLHILSPFQNGQVKVVDGQVMALYNPLEQLLENHKKAILIDIDTYAKDVCKFGSWNPATLEDLKAEAAHGLNSIAGSGTTFILEKEGQHYIVVKELDGTITAAAKISAGSFHYEVESKMEIMNEVCCNAVIIADRKHLVER